jgi:quercetin dioxygenase-like cupin family protein
MNMAQPVVHRWDAMDKEDIGPLIQRRIVTGDDLMIAHVYMQAGNVVPRHAHENEQMTYIPEGRLEMTIGDADPVVVGPGEIVCIPAGVPHSALALEDLLDIDVFTPPRQDWLDGTDDYLRG